MSAEAWFIAALFLVPAVTLTTWVWFTMARVEADLRRPDPFDGLHFEIGAQPFDPAAALDPGGTVATGSAGQAARPIHGGTP